jgi:hypothetical protein
MAADYRQFKTPFYEITVGDPFWKRTVKLPHHIMRLVEKVEIVETMVLNDSAVPSSVTVVFNEGSREPASPDYKLGTAGLYQVPIEGNKVDMDVAGSLTNRSGIITDLRFSGAHGITFLTEKEKKTGKIDTAEQKNVENKDTTRSYKYEDKAPLFLFQERNRIKVTWGYLEDPSTVRSVMMHIQVVTTEFPQEGMPRTTVTGLSFSSIADQMTTKKAKVFGKRKLTSKAGDSLIEFEDLKTDELIRQIAKDAGMAAIISKNLLNEIADKDKQKMWLAGESFHQFMKKMADNSGCYYEIKTDPSTGKEIIFFIKYADFEKRVVISDKELLQWKGPGSILKSVNVNADFGGMLGNKQAGLDEKGEEGSVDSKNNRRILRQFNTPDGKQEQAMATDPIGNNANPTAKAISEKIANDGTTGTVDNTPTISIKNREDKSEARANKDAKMIQIDFSTIGYTRLIPGVMEITGIGVRYSGKYRIISVTHTIDSSGYACKCSGNSQMLAAGGVVIPSGAPKGEDPSVPRRIINTPDTSSTHGDDQTGEDYRKAMYKK